MPALTPTSTSVLKMNGIGYEPPYVTVSGSVSYFVGSELRELRGEPITYTITDRTTEGMIGSFNGASNGYALCSIVFHLNGGTFTYVGEATHGYPACALAPVSFPSSHLASISASYAGNATYAPSVSKQEPF
jgi:hypothetical protein